MDDSLSAQLTSAIATALGLDASILAGGLTAFLAPAIGVDVEALARLILIVRVFGRSRSLYAIEDQSSSALAVADFSRSSVSLTEVS